MSQIGFVGLGTMGAPMARRLVEAGHDVTVWNRSAGPADELVEAGAQRAETVGGAFDQEIVLSVLADDGAVEEQVLASGVLGESRCVVHVNMATISPQLADAVERAHAEHGIGYVAAPVLGRADVAAKGELNILLAGGEDAKKVARPILEELAAKVWELGDKPSRANIVKIAVNLLLGAAITATAEATALVEAYDIDSAELIDLVGHSLFPGPVYSGYGSSMNDHSYRPAGFTTRMGLKDTRLALDAAHSHSLALPVASLVQDALLQAIAQGAGDDDWAALAEVARARLPR